MNRVLIATKVRQAIFERVTQFSKEITSFTHKSDLKKKVRNGIAFFVEVRKV